MHNMFSSPAGLASLRSAIFLTCLDFVITSNLTGGSLTNVNQPRQRLSDLETSESTAVVSLLLQTFRNFLSVVHFFA